MSFLHSYTTDYSLLFISKSEVSTFLFLFSSTFASSSWLGTPLIARCIWSSWLCLRFGINIVIKWLHCKVLRLVDLHLFIQGVRNAGLLGSVALDNFTFLGKWTFLFFTFFANLLRDPRRSDPGRVNLIAISPFRARVALLFACLRLVSVTGNRVPLAVVALNLLDEPILEVIQFLRVFFAVNVNLSLQFPLLDHHLVHEVLGLLKLLSSLLPLNLSRLFECVNEVLHVLIVHSNILVQDLFIIFTSGENNYFVLLKLSEILENLIRFFV